MHGAGAEAVLHPRGGEPKRREELPLRGYRDSRPVRYGNAAGHQLQLDAWGDLLETTSLYVGHGNTLDAGTAKMLAGCLDRAAIVWQDADSGIWELEDHRHYTSSKMGAWLAFDRALDLAEHGELPDEHANHWRKQRDAAQAFVEARCWSEETGAYVEYAGGDSLDASVLRGARMGWGKVSPERFARTIDTVREQLDAGDRLLYRTSARARNRRSLPRVLLLARVRSRAARAAPTRPPSSSSR